MIFTSIDIPFVKKTYFDQIRNISQISKIITYPDSPVNNFEVIRRIGTSDIITQDIFVNINKNIIDSSPNLKAIFCQSVGYDNIDHVYAKSKGIKVYNCPGFNANAVAEFAFSLITSLFRKIPSAQSHVKSGGWMYRYFEGNELMGKTVGIIGYGHVGSRISQISKGYGLKVLVTLHDSTKKIASNYVDNIVSLNKLLQKSDIVILAVPLTKDTLHLIGKTEIGLMKTTSILVNVSRHTVVDEYALASSLIHHKIFGAALDLMITEPFNVKNYSVEIQEMVNLPNVIVTPHIAGVSKESSVTLGNMFVQNIKNYLNGDLTNCINL